MKRSFLFVLLAAAAFSANGQNQFGMAELEAGRFVQKSVSGLRSMSDGVHYTAVTPDDAIIRYSYLTGEPVDTLCDIRKYVDASISFDGYELSSDEKRILLRLDSSPVYRRSALSEYVMIDLQSGGILPLLDRGKDYSNQVRYATLSPDATKAALVYANNIYILDIDGKSILPVTKDGEINHIINGVPDWVYEEEFGLYHALRWSPDGKRLAFLRFDESGVKEFAMNYFVQGDTRSTDEYKAGNRAAPVYPYTYTFKYPKAGEANSVVSLHVFDLSTGLVSDVASVPGTEYIPHFDWTPDGQLYYYCLDRLQRHLMVCLGHEEPRIIYEEKSPYYIDDVGPGTITFLPDSFRFIVRNETRTGYWHLYMHDINKGFRYALTEGEWDVKELIHAGDGKIWYLSNERSQIRNDLWTADIRGKGRGKQRLTTSDGNYRIQPSRGCKYYLSYFSNATTPNTVTLHDSEGKLIRTLEDNARLKEYIKEVRLPRKEFFVFSQMIDGERVEFNCYMIRPADFNPGAVKHPLLITQYSGPGSQEVSDRWYVGWEDALVQQGYVVACIDPRGTGGKGEAFKKATYGKLGELETIDQIAFAENMASRPFIDRSRVGIYGWSYGGFMSLNCLLRGAETYKMAVSVAPVTSWRLYDSIYTERYNGLPQDNPDGYDNPSPINHASRLEGKLLLIHGSADDNVHVQNSYKMAHELVKAGKQFDMMIYTDDNHSMMPSGRWNVRRKMLSYCLENL